MPGAICLQRCKISGKITCLDTTHILGNEKTEWNDFLSDPPVLACRVEKIVFSVSDKWLQVFNLKIFVGKNCFIQKKVLILSSGGEDSRENGILN